MYFFFLLLLIKYGVFLLTMFDTLCTLHIASNTENKYVVCSLGQFNFAMTSLCGFSVSCTRMSYVISFIYLTTLLITLTS